MTMSSKKVTRVKIYGMAPLNLIDFIPLEQAKTEAEQYYRMQLTSAALALDGLKTGDYEVCHQYGIYRSRIVRVLKEREQR
jgi:hypothetical protein